MTSTSRARSWNPRGIQTRVLLLVGLGMLALLAIMGGTSWVALNSLGQKLLAEREHLAQSVADHVQYALRSDLELLQGVSSGPHLNLQNQDLAPERLVLGDLYLRSHLFERVFLIGKDGRMLAAEPASDRSAGHDVAPFSVVAQEALRSGRPTVSNLEIDARGAKHLYAVVPVRSWLGEVVGLVGGEMNPTGVRFEPLLPTFRVGESGSIDLIDSHGVVIGSTDATRLFFAGDQAATLAQLIRERRTGIESCSGCRQPGNEGSRANEVAAVVPLSVAPWGVSVRQLERETLAPIMTLQRDILLLGPALMGLALVFAWGAARSVKRPIAILTREAERIAAGGLDRPIPPLADDEIGRLGRSFEKMRVALGESLEGIARANQDLEQRVEERTRELQRLYRELQEREEWRAQLLRKVISAQEDERKRLARELHDETSQTLSALAMGLETASAAFPSELARQRLEEAKGLTVRTIEELHRVIYDLRPSVLDDLGLLPAIRWYAERHLEPKGMTVRCEFNGPDRRLPPEIDTALFRVAQEAITNIAKHARADAVLIQCALREDQLSIEIEDDGEGFDPAALPAPGASTRGLGLMGMRERVELLGGRIEIDAAPGQGVRVAVTVPISAETGHA